MGEELDVVSPAMREYASKAQAAGERIAGVDLATPAGRLSRILPGGTAAAAAARCSLNHELPRWGEAIARQGHKVGSADDHYTANELGIGELLDDLTGFLFHGGGGR